MAAVLIGSVAIIQVVQTGRCIGYTVHAITAIHLGPSTSPRPTVKVRLDGTVNKRHTGGRAVIR